MSPKYRSRLVARQMKAHDHSGASYFALAPPLEALRTVLSLAVTSIGNHVPILDPGSRMRSQVSFIDVARAYFNAKIDEHEAPTFVRLKEEDPDSTDYVRPASEAHVWNQDGCRWLARRVPYLLDQPRLRVRSRARQLLPQREEGLQVLSARRRLHDVRAVRRAGLVRKDDGSTLRDNDRTKTGARPERRQRGPRAQQDRSLDGRGNRVRSRSPPI